MVKPSLFDLKGFSHRFSRFFAFFVKKSQHRDDLEVSCETRMRAKQSYTWIRRFRKISKIFPEVSSTGPIFNDYSCPGACLGLCGSTTPPLGFIFFFLFSAPPPPLVPLVGI